MSRRIQAASLLASSLRLAIFTGHTFAIARLVLTQLTGLRLAALSFALFTGLSLLAGLRFLLLAPLLLALSLGVLLALTQRLLESLQLLAGQVLELLRLHLVFQLVELLRRAVEGVLSIFLILILQGFRRFFQLLQELFESGPRIRRSLLQALLQILVCFGRVLAELFGELSQFVSGEVELFLHHRIGCGLGQV